MLAGIISGLLTAAAILLALWSLKRIGNDAYAMIVSERFERRHVNNDIHNHAENNALKTSAPNAEQKAPAASSHKLNKENSHGN